MSSIFEYILIAILAACASGQTSIEFQRCEERVISKCPCGPGGDLTDVYVDGCLVISNDSLPCQPCPGSCNLFLNCEKCSKHECLSCPIGKTGPTCELLYSDDDSSTENNNSVVQNAEKSESSTNANPAKIVEYGFDKPMPNVVALHLNKMQNSSFRPATDDIRPEIKLDIIEFNVGNTSIVELIPENAPYVLKDNSTNMKENILDAPQICTTNCSNDMENQDLIGTEESNIDVLSNNETNFGNKIDTIDSQKNDTPFGEFHTFGDPLPPVKDSVNASSYKIQEVDKFLRQVLKQSANNERDQLEQGGSPEQDLSDAYHPDYPENPAISSSQDAASERQNKADSQNKGSQPEIDRKTTAETKYVYISANEDNESKYPDSEYESSEQEQISGEKLFHNTEKNGPSTYIESDPAMDNVEQTNEEYSEVQKNGAVDLEKEQPLTSLDTIQQQNDQYFENHEHIHKPIPKDVGILKYSSGNPSYFIYFDPRHVRNPVPSFASPHSHRHYKPLNTNDALQSFQKNRVPPLFNYLANMLRRHIAAYEGGGSNSEKNRVQQSETMNTMKYVVPLLFNPADTSSRFGVVTGDGLQKPISGISMMSLNLEPKNGLPTESVAKGQILIANVNHENNTDPRIVPGSVLTQDFEFEIPSLSADSEESKYLKKTDRSKYSKGSGRFRSLHTKRRRNGVKNDFSKCDPWMEDCPTLHGKITQTHIRRKANHAMKSKTSRKDLNNLGYVRVRYVKDDYEPMYDSSEISESSMSNENMPVYSQALVYDPQDMDYEMENLTAEYETLQASSEANSDSESNRRRSRRDIEATPFCPIPKDSRNGDLDCTIWSYKKTCTLICHNGYTSPSRYFTCQRSKNTWVPSMVSCRGGPEYEPAEDTQVQLKQLDGNDYEEEPQPPPRVEDDNKDYVESSSGEMGVRDQSGAEEEVPLTDVPIKTGAHKKKSHRNKEDYDGKSSVEMGGQDEDEGAAASKSVKRKKAHQNKVKKQDEYQKEVDDTLKVHGAQEKDEPKQIQNAVAENEDEWKEETGDDVPKTGSAEDQPAEESSNEEVDEAPKEEEIGQNDVDAEYEE
ncbi:hypothetical protein JTE90_002209 [Oedothorax gibbosus]|uniref:Sushi domain-containing protein n=1 Tax=Oedothorax gibbosus TaxID=931172 RepID=A0AAV6VFT4_9ARAC|nr:hypothetical protein JTE90_002209 [Oedothorax gibbosus]